MKQDPLFTSELSLSLKDPVSTMLALKPDMDTEFGIISELIVENDRLIIKLKSDNMKSYIKSTGSILERIKLSEETIKFAIEDE